MHMLSIFGPGGHPTLSTLLCNTSQLNSRLLFKITKSVEKEFRSRLRLDFDTIYYVRYNPKLSFPDMHF